MKDLLKVAEKAAREAGYLLSENFRKINTIEKKSDKSLVTDIDKRAESMIAGIIKSNWPDHNIVGEESGMRQNGGAFTWVIDPIDGTHNFIRGIELFGISIGILKGQEFVGGVIYIPFEDALYSAELGSGAYKNDERISVSSIGKLEDCTLLFDSGFKSGAERKIEIFQKIAPKVFNVRMFGASIRNLTYVAEGIADILLELDDNIWDYAAGVVILKEAGGRVTDLDGNALTPQSRSYIASNSYVHELIKKVIR